MKIQKRFGTNAHGETVIHKRCRLVSVGATDPETCEFVTNGFVVSVDGRRIETGDFIEPGQEIRVAFEVPRRTWFYSPVIDVEEP